MNQTFPAQHQMRQLDRQGSEIRDQRSEIRDSEINLQCPISLLDVNLLAIIHRPKGAGRFLHFQKTAALS
jgi:hypothetical protein